MIVVQAPGRVNLIGEHTDYNGGFVLPMAIDRKIVIATGKRTDRCVSLYAENFSERVEFSLPEIKREKRYTWANYVKAVMNVLSARGYELHGVNMVIAGDIPLGSGLSSSAALEVATALALQAINNFVVPPLEMIKICQQAENEFVGARCGIMDQFISRLAKKDTAIFLDCLNEEYEYVPLSTDEFRVVLCNTGVHRRLAQSEYNRRCKECEEAVVIMRQRLPDIHFLRDVPSTEYQGLRASLPPVLQKRVDHVICENKRTLEAADSLRKREMAVFGKLMYQSHESLRDNYEVSCPELDYLVGISRRIKGVVGARMTGGGFGGCTVNLVRESTIEEFQRVVKEKYFARTGIHAEIYVCKAEAGASLVGE